MGNIKKYNILPVAKPRMVMSDRYRRRAPVQKYWNYKAHCKLLDLEIPDRPLKVCFILPMPKSWSKKKKKLMRYTKHKQVPDLDNLIKGLGDILDDDAFIDEWTCAKFWGDYACMVIEELDTAIPFPEIAK